MMSLHRENILDCKTPCIIYLKLSLHILPDPGPFIFVFDCLGKVVQHDPNKLCEALWHVWFVNFFPLVGPEEEIFILLSKSANRQLIDI